LNAFRLGAKDYLGKPLRETELVSSFDRALSEVRLRRERETLSERLAAANHQLERRVKEITTLAGIGKAVTAVTTLDHLFTRLLEAGLYVTEAEVGWLMLSEEGASVPVDDAATPAADAGNGPVEPCTGKSGASGNDTRNWNGVNYLVHFPSNLDPNEPVPLVFVAHGFTMSGPVMQRLTGFDAIADREGFVVVYPDGDGGATPWNVGPGACAPGSLVDAPFADSFAYLDAMRASVEEDQCIHPKQIFVTGFSMGGYFSNNVGCQRGNEFARSVGPHSGGTYPGVCPGAPVPIFIMHGANDGFIDVNLCGKGARDFWIERNGCDNDFEMRPTPGGNCEWYNGCDENGQTVYCEYTGVAHSWAGENASAAVWDFFKTYL
jgi:poly(3-hydroxybutyrate) depolymerase